jgi:hypothetical protein
VRRFFAVHFPDFARQRFLCRAEAHGKERLHGNAYFSGSVSSCGAKQTEKSRHAFYT